MKKTAINSAVLEALKKDVITKEQANAFLSGIEKKQASSNEKQQITVCIIELFNYSEIPYKSGNRVVIKDVLSTELDIDISNVQKRITEWEKHKKECGLIKVIDCLYKPNAGIMGVFSVQNNQILKSKNVFGGENGMMIESISCPDSPLLKTIISNIEVNLRQNNLRNK